MTPVDPMATYEEVYGSDDEEHSNAVPNRRASRRSQAIVIRVADITREFVRWLWLHRLPLGKLVVFDGDPAMLKSTITLDWTARVTTGSPWPDGESMRFAGAVVLLTA